MIGTLVSVDQYLNVKLKGIKVADEKAHPQLSCMKNCFIRGSAVRFVNVNTTMNVCIFYKVLVLWIDTYRYLLRRWTQNCCKMRPEKKIPLDKRSLLSLHTYLFYVFCKYNKNFRICCLTLNNILHS